MSKPPSPVSCQIILQSTLESNNNNNDDDDDDDDDGKLY